MGKGGLVVIALVAAFLAISGCGGSSEGSGDAAHINDESGSTNDLVADERTGTSPPPAKLTNLRKAAEAADCYLLLGTKPEKGKQVSPGTPTPKYQTDPPASGDYVEPPHQQADGAYMNLVDPINQLGALNNGRMTIQYAPDLDEETQLELKGLYDTMYGATLFFPNDEMQYAVAATTWTNFLGCTSYDTQKTLDALRAFGKATWGKHGGNPVEEFPFEGPTPADPEES
ncbi:MAG: DUF3105 domain-containing protein [Actinomycetota bacterium]|nr:DUF3105 domain-containing protein [Actinomycetota bacterium]